MIGLLLRAAPSAPPPEGEGERKEKSGGVAPSAPAPSLSLLYLPYLLIRHVRSLLQPPPLAPAGPARGSWLRRLGQERVSLGASEPGAPDKLLIFYFRARRPL
jgi:hypothetical protein